MDILISNDKNINLDVSSDKSLSIELIDSGGKELTLLNSSNVIQLGIENKQENLIDISSISLELVIENKPEIQSIVSGDSASLDFTLNAIPGIQGSQGIQGERGFSGNSEDYVAGSSILAFRIVTTDINNKLVYADANNINTVNRAIGISTNSGIIDNTISVQLFGSITNSGWNFVPNELLYLGVDGEVTRNHVGVYSQNIGYAKSSTEIILKIGRAVLRG